MMRRLPILLLAIGAGACTHPRPAFKEQRCFHLAHTTGQVTSPDYLVFLPGADTGLVGVAASPEKAPSPGSAFASAVVWRQQADTLHFTFSSATTTAGYALRHDERALSGVVVRSVHVSLGADGPPAFSHTDTASVHGEAVDCARLPRGLPAALRRSDAD